MTTIAPGTLADHAEIVTIIRDAFLEDKPSRAILGGTNTDYPQRLHAMFDALLREPLAHGTVDVARDGGAILGAAVWHAPDSSSSVLHYLTQLPALLRAFGFPGILRAQRIYSGVADYRPRRPHWYLQAIGVSAAARGKGVGSALLDHRLVTIDTDSLGAYLESSSKRTGKLYASRGFEVTRRIDAWPADAPYGMWRQPSLIRVT